MLLKVKIQEKMIQTKITFIIVSLAVLDLMFVFVSCFLFRVK